MNKLGVLLAIGVIGAGFWYAMRPANNGAPLATELPGGAIVAVKVPAALVEKEQVGKRAYDVACAACHGANAQGTQGIAPPLVHKIYEPSHHGDMSFVLAAKNGVRAHHWKFGNMPQVSGVTQADVLNIVAYVRALQRENGIN